MENKLLDQNTKDQITELLNNMKKPITIILFTKENCEHCNITVQLFNELKELNSNLNLNVYDINKDIEIASKYNISDAPAYLILDSNNLQTNFVFYGVPAGHEFSTLLTHLIDVSGDERLFENETIETIKNFNKDINIKVFVTTSCPHCPGAAINASRLSLINPKIKAEIYEASSFNEIANKYNVTGVPKIVINETEELMGNQPIEEYLNVINKL